MSVYQCGKDVAVKSWACLPWLCLRNVASPPRRAPPIITITLEKRRADVDAGESLED